MVEKRFEKLGMPDIERFENYLPTAFNSELTLLQKVNKIIFNLIETNKLTNEMIDYLNNFIEKFDEKLYKTIGDVLQVWLEDGILADIVRVSINDEVIEAREDIENETHIKLTNRLDKWENRTIRLEDDVKTKHLNIEWYADKNTKDYTTIFDELTLLSLNTGVPIFLPEFKIYNSKKTYPSNLFYGNGKMFDLTSGKETQISSTPDNVKQYVNGDMKHKNLFGTFNNANVQSLVANDVSWLSGIMGIYPDKPERLSTYGNRDNTTQFLGMSTHNNYLEFNASQVTYLEDGVYIPSLTKEMEVPIGSILDTRHDPFYSGLVKSIDYDTKKITLYKGWFKVDGSSEMGIPSNSFGLTINRTTAIWCANWLLYLDENHDSTQATMFEAGIVNNQPHVENINGIMMLQQGKYGGNRAFQSRTTSDNNKWLVGFHDEESNISFESYSPYAFGAYVYNAKQASFVSSMSPVALYVLGDSESKLIDSYVDGVNFRMSGSGVQNKIGLEHSVVQNDGELDLSKAVHIIKDGVTLVTLPRDSKYYGLVIDILTLSENTVGIQGYLNIDGNSLTGYNLTKGQSIRLFSDGNSWFKLG